MQALYRSRRFLTLVCSTLVTFVGQPVFPQIVIQKQHVLNLFGPGTSHRYSEGIEGNINIGKAGGPNVYDFTAFNLTNLQTSYNYQASTIPLMAGRYPSTAVTMGDSPTTIEKNPVFLFDTDTAYVLGEASLIPTPRFSHHSPGEIMMVFPTAYGASHSQTRTEYDTTFTAGGLVSATSVSTSLEVTTVDGYGILKLAGREYNCLRMKKAHNGYGDKEFIYMTQEGALVLVAGIPLSSPDTGLVPAGAQVLLANSIAAVGKDVTVPMELALSQNYPNPFNPSTVVRCTLPVSGWTRLAIYDVLGREVALLVDAALESGTFTFTFDASGMSSGVYLARLQSGGSTRSIKMLLDR